MYMSLVMCVLISFMQLACKDCLHAIGYTDGHADAHAQLIVCSLNVCFLTVGCSYVNVFSVQ